MKRSLAALVCVALVLAPAPALAQTIVQDDAHVGCKVAMRVADWGKAAVDCQQASEEDAETATHSPYESDAYWTMNLLAGLDLLAAASANSHFDIPTARMQRENATEDLTWVSHAAPYAWMRAGAKHGLAILSAMRV